MLKFDPNNNKWSNIFGWMCAAGIVVEAFATGEVPSVGSIITLFLAAVFFTVFLPAAGFCRRKEKGNLFELTFNIGFIYGAALATIGVMMAQKAGFNVQLFGINFTLTNVKAVDFTLSMALLVLVIIRIALAYYGAGFLSNKLRRDILMDMDIPAPVWRLICKLQMYEEWKLADTFIRALGKGKGARCLQDGTWLAIKDVLREELGQEYDFVIKIVEELLPTCIEWDWCSDWRILLSDDFIADFDEKRLARFEAMEGDEAKKRRHSRKTTAVS